MSSRPPRRLARATLALVLWPLHALARAGFILFAALAGAFGPPPPRPFRQEDDVVQVANQNRERR